MIVPDYNSLSPAEAFHIQKEMREELRLHPLTQPLRTIGGADISYNKFSEDVYAGIVVLEFPSMKILERAGVRTKSLFPYVPGLLAYREVPALAEAWNKLGEKPDLLVMDGQGIAHPRGFGVACHFGVLSGVATMGCGKTRLCGTFEEPGDVRGSYSDLMLKGVKIGEVLRTKTKTNPVFISPGYGVTGEECREIILQCDGGYRIPEPTRQAHLFVNELRLADKTDA